MQNQKRLSPAAGKWSVSNTPGPSPEPVGPLASPRASAADRLSAPPRQQKQAATYTPQGLNPVSNAAHRGMTNGAAHIAGSE